MGLFCVLFGFVVLVLFLFSNCLIPFSSHKSCGVFQVSVEGHWTYSWTYVLVRRVSLRLLNLDCRYPRDLLQPAREKKNSVNSNLFIMQTGAFSPSKLQFRMTTDDSIGWAFAESAGVFGCQRAMEATGHTRKQQGSKTGCLNAPHRHSENLVASGRVPNGM